MFYFVSFEACLKSYNQLTYKINNVRILLSLQNQEFLKQELH